jgi:hypothetical protein
VHVENTTLCHKSLLEAQQPGLWDRLVGRIVKDEEMSRHDAELIMNEAIGFLLLISRSDKGSFSPSDLVDIGWHKFMIYSREYTEFCAVNNLDNDENGVGRYIHHSPNDVVGVDYPDGAVARTVAAMQVHGIAFNPAIWPEGASCAGGPGTCAGGDCTNN